ncbi:MAG: 30S ribosome-binding factor RbfA [Arenicella sp.]
MPKDFPRSDRVAQLVSRALANLIKLEVNDERVNSLTVVDVEVSRDLRHAEVFVIGPDLSDKQAIDDSMKALDRAGKFLRHRLMKSLDMRRCPDLHFKYDHSIKRGADISALIDSALADSNSNE